MWIQLTLFKNRYKERIIKYIKAFNILKIVVLVFYYRNILANDIEAANVNKLLTNKKRPEKGAFVERFMLYDQIIILLTKMYYSHFSQN